MGTRKCGSRSPVDRRPGHDGHFLIWDQSMLSGLPTLPNTFGFPKAFNNSNSYLP